MPLKLDLYRHTFNTDGDRNIIGDMFTNSKYFCHTLEDERRADGVKVYGETCIAPGKYKFKVTMSNRFKRLMIQILDVPDFEGIRIHGGNTSKDSHGCPLVGYNTDGKKIWGTAEKALTKWAIDGGGEGIIEIHDVPFTYDKINKKLKI